MPIALTDGGANIDFTTKLPVFVNGQLLEHVHTVTMTLDTGQTKVFTQELGFAGFAEGEEFVSLDVKMAVPVSGPEINTWNMARAREWATVQVGCGRVDHVSTGKFLTTTKTRSGTAPVEHGWTWEARSEDLE